MKVVILAGGLGTRISEETDLRPKPMIEIGGKPIIWHIMKTYSHYGFNEFVVCLGYKGYLIKEYFANYYLHQSNVTIDLQRNTTQIHHSQSEPWSVTLVDTGLKTQTGGRIRRVREYVGDHEFMMTYGDGVSNVPIDKLIEQHRRGGTLATITSVQPQGRFGSLALAESGMVEAFKEKPAGDGYWVNGGYFVLSPKVFDLIESDETIWERGPLETLAAEKQLNAYLHRGFWKPMDTLRDKIELEEMWKSPSPPWKIWDE